MEYSSPLPRGQQNRFKFKFKFSSIIDVLKLVQKQIAFVLHRVRHIGDSELLGEQERSKLGIFNQLNFLQFITGIIVPVVGLFNANSFPALGWLMASLPAVVSVAVIILNSYRLHQWAVLTYFILYPVFICVSYINGMSLGVELSFIMYGILSVFFIQDIGYMIFSICLSMISYFILSVVWKNYPYQLEYVNYIVYLINQLLAITYIFYGLYLIKRENTTYEVNILAKNTELHKQSALLKEQAEELDQLNNLKDKLFSVIAHDLKSPMYALRNLFRNAYQHNMSLREIKEMLPDVVNDLNYTTGLMENLLQWAKSQMKSNAVRPQRIDVSELTHEVIQLLHLQADAKKICIENKAELPSVAWADKDMVNLVLRNLLSNAIKFTPEKGKIVIGAYESQECIEVFVQDSGRGISREEMLNINKNAFYTTNGTNSENGTGLGLMLCREFLGKNGGRLMIESEPGKGSTFSFTLPLAQ